MKRLWTLMDAMDSVLDIEGLAGGDYHCDKCTNRVRRNKPDAPVQRHPIVRFRVLDRHLWELQRPGAVLVYMLTAESGAGTIPRYIGVSKANCFRGRWTRLPGTEKHRFKTGDLMHHQPAQMLRIEAEAAGPLLAEGRGRLRLYGTTVPQLVPLVLDRTLWAPRLARTGDPGASITAQYDFARSLEDDTADLMLDLGLVPWNRTQGRDARPVTAQLGAGAFTEARFRRP